jgi:hypothetical protein
MTERFQHHQIDLQFVPPVYIEDTRIPSNVEEKRTWAIMLQHLDSIRSFLENTNNTYLIVCEDDILLSKHFMEDLPGIINKYNEYELDLLLMGYLIDFSFEKTHYAKINEPAYQFIEKEFTLMKPPGHKYDFYTFPYQLWGCQMYLMDRKHAKFLLDKYTIEYGMTNNGPYSPDWTITKDGKHAILYPMIAIEEGNTKTDHYGQNYFHQNCFNKNYDPEVF